MNIYCSLIGETHVSSVAFVTTHYSDKYDMWILLWLFSRHNPHDTKDNSVDTGSNLLQVDQHMARHSRCNAIVDLVVLHWSSTRESNNSIIWRATHRHLMGCVCNKYEVNRSNRDGTIERTRQNIRKTRVTFTFDLLTQQWCATHLTILTFYIFHYIMLPYAYLPILTSEVWSYISYDVVISGNGVLVCKIWSSGHRWLGGERTISWML